jgi:glycerol uptake facilitator protein
VPAYWTAQVLRCFVGAALVYLVYNEAINHFDQVNHIVRGTPKSLPTDSTFATFPAPYFHNVLGPLIAQIVGTFFRTRSRGVGIGNAFPSVTFARSRASRG